MSATIPDTEPTSIIAGDTVKWTMYLADYLPADGWVLTYSFVRSGAKVDVTCTDNGDGSHLATITKTNTAAMTADDDWHFQGYVSKSGERFTVRTGSLKVITNYATATSGVDARSTTKQILDALEAALLTNAAKGHVSSSVGSGSSSWSIAWKSHVELIESIEKYRALYNRELAAERIAQGLSSRKRVLVRFV